MIHVKPMEAKLIPLPQPVPTVESLLADIKGLMIEMEKPLSMKEAAEHCGVLPCTLGRQIKRGVFPAALVHKGFDGRPKFFKSEITAYLKTQ